MGILHIVVAIGILHIVVAIGILHIVVAITTTICNIPNYNNM
jgi:hypothetical protein